MENQYLEFHEAINKGPTEICNSCNKLFYEVRTTHVSDKWLHLVSPLLPENAKMISTCANCLKFLKQGKLPPCCSLNNLHVPEIPDQLLNLNTIEERMLARVHPYMKLVVLPQGQRAINGQVINFPSNIEQQVNQFTSTGIIIVKAENGTSIPHQYVANIQKVKEGLAWLEANNHLYTDINTTVCEQDAIPSIMTIPASSEKMPEHINDDHILETSVISKDPVMPLMDYSELLGLKKGPHDANVPIPVFTLPKNRNPPINTFTDANTEQLSFPWLFPDGKNALKSFRPIRLTTLRYFQCRLLSADPRWALSMPYLFWTTNYTEKQKLSENVSIATRIKNSGSNASSAGQVRADITSNPEYPEHSFGFMKSIRGSSAYWKSAQMDLFSMIKNIGPPTWFITLSANDLNWEDLMRILCKRHNMQSDAAFISALPRDEKVKLMTSDPITTARHFSHRVHHFIHRVILSKAHPIGEVSEYYWRIEFQQRGSPHVHSLWWIKDAPNLDTLHGLKEAPAFIDKYITTQIPPLGQDDDLRSKVLTLQSHHHTKTCRKYKTDGQCRFGFPQPLQDQTKMLSTEDMARSPKCYAIKRIAGTEQINQYNATLLRHWNANMDIQMVGSAYGAARYVCAYVCKRESDEVSTATKEAMKNLPADSNLRKRLFSLGNIFLTHRQLSAQEAAYKMCGLPLRSATRQVTFLNTGTPNKRCRVLLPKNQLAKLDDESTDIFASNVVDRYGYRPNTETFNPLSLFEFASHYRFTSKKSTSQKVHQFELLNGLGYLQERTKNILIRTPQFTSEIHGDTYYYALLFLHVPWRKESELTAGHISAEAAFMAKKDDIHIHESTFGEDVERAVRQLQMLQDDVLNNYVAPLVAPNNDSTEKEHQSEMTKPDSSIYNMIDSVVPMTHPEFAVDKSRFSVAGDIRDAGSECQEIMSLMTNRMTDMEFTASVASLNQEQQNAYSVIKLYFRELHQFCQGLCKRPEPVHLFISGPGGTAKSHLIKVLREYIMRVSTPNRVSCMVTAPTGVAAFNIRGITIHKALCLPVEHGKYSSCTPLGSEKLASLRREWESVNTLIIDEISMVSYDMLKDINFRVNQIKGIDNTNIFFGNLNVIALGDLFQLPPVHGEFVFSTRKQLQMSTHLWRDLFTFIDLTQNMRQKGDTRFAESLLRFRTGCHTIDDINMLATRTLDHVDINSEPFAASLHLYPKLSQCADFNSRKLAALPGVITIKATDKLIDIQGAAKRKILPILQQKKISDLLPADERDCAGLSSTLDLAIGAVIMLRRNIQCSDGLVNGARVITGINWQHGRSGESGIMPLSIDVQFFDRSIGRITRALAPGMQSASITIEPLSAKFYGKSGSVLQRTQFPLCLCWAATIHKAQGLTLDQVVIDIGRNVFADGMAYVAMSRVKSLNGLAIIQLDSKSIKASSPVSDEMLRLQAL
jgi:DNA replication protein DnaC